MENKLEDRPIITLGGGSPALGVDSETYERYRKWFREVYAPMLLSLPGRTGIDSYLVTKESAEYPSSVTLIHTESIKFTLESLKNPARTAVMEELATWMKRRVSVQIWNERYALLKSFRSETSGTPLKEDTKIENAPFLHLESYHLRSEDQAKYINWLNDYGFISHIPLLMRLPGIKGYDCYQDISHQGLGERREWSTLNFFQSCILKTRRRLKTTQRVRSS